MKKCIAVLLALFLLSGSVYGCADSAANENANPGSRPQPNETVSSEATNGTVKEEPSDAGRTDSGSLADARRIQLTLSSGVAVDADVALPFAVDLSNLSTYEAKLKPQDFDKMVEILAPEKKITEKVTEFTAGSRLSDEYTYAVTEDGYSIMTDEEDLVFNGPLFNDKINSLFIPGGLDKNSDQYLTGKELGFAAIAQAQAEMNRVLKGLGISVGEPICYSLDYETLQSESIKWNEGITDETAAFLGIEPVEILPEDECYLFYYQLTVDRMPVSVYQNGISRDGSYTGGTSVTACYSKDGIFYFYMPYEFSDDLKKLDTQNGMDAEDALQLLDDKYNSVIMEGDYLVTGIEFEYVPQPVKDETNLFTLVPAWRFTIVHTYELAAKDDSGGTVPWTDTSAVVFHAVSGNELITDLGGI